MSEEPNDQRFSFSLGETLKKRLYRAARKLSTKKKLVLPAQLVREALESYLPRVEAALPKDDLPDPVSEGVMSVVEDLARKLDLEPRSLLLLIAYEHLEEYRKRAEERQERLRKLLEGGENR